MSSTPSPLQPTQSRFCDNEGAMVSHERCVHAHSHRAHTTTGHRYLACAAPSDSTMKARRSRHDLCSPRPRPAEHHISDGSLLHGIMFSAPSTRHPTQAGTKWRPTARPSYKTPQLHAVKFFTCQHAKFSATQTPRRANPSALCCRYIAKSVHTKLYRLHINKCAHRRMWLARTIRTTPSAKNQKKTHRNNACVNNHHLRRRKSCPMSCIRTSEDSASNGKRSGNICVCADVCLDLIANAQRS